MGPPAAGQASEQERGRGRGQEGSKALTHFAALLPQQPSHCAEVGRKGGGGGW